MLDDIPAIDPPLPHPVDDEETDRITIKFAAQLAGDSLDASPDGLRIDRYINAEVRARGGMGRVFVAYDPGLDRTVALKALPVGLLPHEPGADTPRREGMALAHIDHPNVVRVLELIEHRGLACLVLEHVDGPHLGDWLKAPRDFHDILHKFLQAGEGLAAVHRAGLVHRDFKPANAVVGPGGVVKLIDFGLAFRPASRRPDEPDDRPGTPRYMAPEQIDGREVDARSDQFSFCVALYEALFRAHPYLSSEDTPSADQHANPFDADAEQASRATIFDQILCGTPRRPERIPPGLRPTVVAALLRGLSPKPEDRHASMDTLLAELRRDPGRSRRRSFLIIAGVLAFTAGLYAVLRPEPCPSLDDEAERIWDGRKKLVQDKLAAFGRGPLTELEQAVAKLADSKIHACRARTSGEVRDTDLARDSCLIRQQSQLREQLEKIARSDSARVAQVLKNLKDQPSTTSCEDVVALRYSCAENDWSAAAGIASTTALLFGDFDRAVARANDAFREAEISGAIGSRVQAHILLGRLAYDRGERGRALHHLTQAVHLAERNACFAHAAQAYHWVAKLAAFDEEIPLPLAEMYSQYHQYRISDEDHQAQAAVLNNRALLAERRAHDLPRAEALLHNAIALRNDAFDQTAGQADSYLNLANVLFAKGQRAEAFLALDKADERRIRAVGTQHPDYAKHLRNRGSFEFQLGNYSRALDFLKQALAQYEAGLGADAPNLGEVHLWLSLTYDRMQDREAALREAQLASRTFPDSTRRAESLEAEAQMLIAANRYAEALPLLDTAEVLLETLDVPPARRGTLDYRRGDALNGLERHRDAERHARLALRRFDEARLPANDEYWAYASLVLGEALNGQSRWGDAAAPFERAIAVWGALDNNKELLAYAWWGLAESLCRLPDRRLDAQRAAREAELAIPVIEPDGDRHLRKQQLAQICRLH